MTRQVILERLKAEARPCASSTVSNLWASSDRWRGATITRRATWTFWLPSTGRPPSTGSWILAQPSHPHRDSTYFPGSVSFFSHYVTGEWCQFQVLIGCMISWRYFEQAVEFQVRRFGRHSFADAKHLALSVGKTIVAT